MRKFKHDKSIWLKHPGIIEFWSLRFNIIELYEGSESGVWGLEKATILFKIFERVI